MKVFSKVANIESQSIITSNFVWPADDYTCNEKVIMCISMLFYYVAQDKRPTHIINVLCVPI